MQLLLDLHSPTSLLSQIHSQGSDGPILSSIQQIP
jgi:hypothetical protein